MARYRKKKQRVDLRNGGRVQAYMGGGFGGCTINLIHKRFIDEFIEEASKSYFEKFSIDLTPIEINICDGVKIKNLQTD